LKILVGSCHWSVSGVRTSTPSTGFGATFVPAPPILE